MENDVAEFVLQKNPPIAEGRVGMPGKGEHSRNIWGQSQPSRCEGKRGGSSSDPNRMGKEDKELVLCVQSWRLKTA